MKLSQEDADLFFKLMWGLQFFVNRRRQLLPQVQSVEQYVALSMDDKVKVRDALWENPGLIDAYIDENPDGRSPDELDMVRQWTQFIQGTFQIFRLLKKHAIFIGQEGQVYGVLGLNNSLDEIFYGRPLPVMVQTVLLPFKGQIVYDGLLKGYNLFFGGGIRSHLKEDYLTAKQNNRIITTLEPATAPVAAKESRTTGKDWKAEIDALLELIEPFTGGPVIQSAAFSLLRASASLAQVAVHRPDELEELWKKEQQVRRALNRVQTALDRVE